ncbi:MAG: hypothetical protein K0R57_5505 [Paenibacillaceae bacterium]|jgi:hypothetical protein|nr:hypothetical protein [Paenibacillaceae bacterium]
MKELRFSIGEPKSIRSSVWKVWVNKSDIYILTRMLGSDSKVSLHESGQCQWSRNFDSVAKFTNAPIRNRDRHIVKWNLPIVNEGEAKHIFRIIIPRSELREINIEENLKKVRWLPLPRTGHAVQIECYITQPLLSAPDTASSPYNHIASLPLADGRWFVLFIQEIVVTEDKKRMIESAKIDALNILLGNDLTIKGELNAVGFTDIGECKGLIELILQRNNDEE